MAPFSYGIGMKSSRIHSKANNVKTDQLNLQDSKSFIKLTLSKVMENEMPIEV